MENIKFNCKDRIVKGEHSPKGEIILEGEPGACYLYLWPKNGTM